ncbi:MAG: DUF4956 domain-containing protein [Chitinophagaceae bacterium]|nr:DUF4956 domain-containing protein [Chitinophagaceae bacterium]
MKKNLFLLLVCLLSGVSIAFAQDLSISSGSVDGGINLSELGIRFAINITAVFVLVRGIYFPKHQNKDFLFTYILFNSINFLICFLLSGANLGVGFAFGLFAIFSIMRYRTVTLPVKEMGYLFLCVAMGLLNALAPAESGYLVLIVANAFILVLALVLDRTTSITYSNDDSKQIEKNTKKIEKLMNQMKNIAPNPAPEWATPLESRNGSMDNTQQITYERIDLIKPEMRDEMIADLRERTGLDVYDVDILKINLMHDIAELVVYFHPAQVFSKNGTSLAQDKF